MVYEWARGTPFKDICALTDVMEGSIVRAMVRLQDLCLVLKVLVLASLSDPARQSIGSLVQALIAVGYCMKSRLGLNSRVLTAIEISAVCQVRLDETCREFRDAARVMGNTALFEQMEAAAAAIKRDVIFAASLYVT